MMKLQQFCANFFFSIVISHFFPKELYTLFCFVFCVISLHSAVLFPQSPIYHFITVALQPHFPSFLLFGLHGHEEMFFRRILVMSGQKISIDTVRKLLSNFQWFFEIQNFRSFWKKNEWKIIFDQFWFKYCERKEEFFTTNGASSSSPQVPCFCDIRQFGCHTHSFPSPSMPLVS